MHNRSLRTLQRFIRPLYEVLARLGKNLNSDVFRDVPALNQNPDEIEVGL